MATYYVGWDVGAWYCDGRGSQDAIVVCDSNKTTVFEGRKVIRTELNECSICGFLNKFFEKACFSEKDVFCLAIDAVFGFPYAMKELINGRLYPLPDNAEAWAPESSINNPILFRCTERYVKGVKKMPMSVVQNNIASQSSKLIYFLRHFEFLQTEIGIWQSGKHQAIETYPSLLGTKGDDLQDAGLCADFAKDFFATAPQDRFRRFHCPVDAMNKTREAYVMDIIKSEGWIWFRKGNTVK